jgi:acetyl-CoA carboxylase biotin carboxyl carrier protein
MELREIKALIALMKEQGLVELEIEDKKGKVRLVRTDHQAAVAAPRPVSPPARPAAPAAAKDSSAAGGPHEVPELEANQALVRSPMVGTFYRAPSPGAAPMVEEGSQVRKGQALCIIEAMKMMNEVEAEVSGTVAKILCENGSPVEYGQPLMILTIG